METELGRNEISMCDARVTALATSTMPSKSVFTIWQRCVGTCEKRPSGRPGKKAMVLKPEPRSLCSDCIWERFELSKRTEAELLSCLQILFLLSEVGLFPLHFGVSIVYAFVCVYAMLTIYLDFYCCCFCVCHYCAMHLFQFRLSAVCVLALVFRCCCIVVLLCAVCCVLSNVCSHCYS